MLWDLEYGEHRKFFEKIQIKGRRTPLDFYVEPDVFTQWLLEAFVFLSPSRVTGFEIGYIPVTEMTSYAGKFPMLLVEHEFCMIIRAIDVVYVNFSKEAGPAKEDEVTE